MGRYYQTKETREPASKLDFSDYSVAFKDRTNAELYRAYLVLSICDIRPLVKNSNFMLKLSYKVIGRGITDWVLRKTFFGHFCAGEDSETIKPTISKLKSNGIGSILDYAAEADVPQPQKRNLNDVSRDLVPARTYDYVDETYCNQNAETFIKAIKAAAENHGDKGFACAKLTALGEPALLEHVSSMLNELRDLFFKLACDTDPACKPGYAAIDRTQKISVEAFLAHLKETNIPITEQDAIAIFKKMDVSKTGFVDYYDWTTYIDPVTLSMGELSHYRITPTLDEEQIRHMENMVARLEYIAHAAHTHKVKLLIDAEQTYMQPAIDHLVLGLQRKYNKKSATIFHTVQCYRKDSTQRLLLDITRCKEEKWIFACKIVRGAYMLQERKRAGDMGYPDPIHDTIEKTHYSFNNAIEILLDNLHICEFMVASHNQQSVQYATSLMASKNIPKTQGVYFGQLLGMCDNVSYSLGANGFQAYKYVPYGPIKEVIPYLIRRAEENAGLMSNASHEKKMLLKELRRRRSSKNW